MLTRREFLGLGLVASASLPLVRLLGSDPEAFVGEEVFERLMRQAGAWKGLSLGDAIGEIGLALLGTPYVGSTLELSNDREFCCVNLRGLDCVTFYETALGLARMIRKGGLTPQALVKEISFMRYRAGKLDGYLSRLHYTSDWLEDNEKKRVVKNLTRGLTGAVRMEKRLNFMSTHPDAYRQLKAHPVWVSRMAALEEEITARRPWYVPNDHVAEIEPLLKTGDVVGIATTADGLDCSHTGLVYVDKLGVCRFLNASSVKKQVVLGDRLSEYALKYKKNLGVMIARPL
jgi:hypothetical protein